MQTRLKPYFDAITLSLTASGISTDVSGIPVLSSVEGNIVLDTEGGDALLGQTGNDVLSGLGNDALNAANDAVFEMRRVA